MSRNTNTTAIPCNKFNEKHLTFEPFNEKTESKSRQWITYPRYKGGQLYVQTPWIQVTGGGLPFIDENSTQTEGDRNYINVAFDPEQNTCMELKKVMSSIDNMIIDDPSVVLKGNVVPTGMKKPRNISKIDFNYSPIVKVPKETINEFSDDGEENEKPKYPKFDKMKLKLDVNYNTKEIVTGVFITETDSDGKKKTRSISIKSIDDLREYYRFKCNVRFIIMMNKVWAGKVPMANADKRSFGCGWKIMQMEIQPVEQTYSARDTFSKFAFMNSDDEDNIIVGDDEEEEEENDNDAVMSDEEEEEEEDNDNEEEEEDNDEDTEEEEDEDSEEEEVILVKPTKKNTRPRKRTDKH